MTYFLLGLQALDDGSELLEGLGGLLVVLDLSGDKLGEVAQRLGRVKDLASLATPSDTLFGFYARSS